jgi:molybdopterin-guanine dinucleotide biosynthesis protein
MKIITFCGVQKSGKTTLIREVVSRLWRRGKKSAIIVNERGEKDYVDKFVQSNEVHIEYLRGG